MALAAPARVTAGQRSRYGRRVTVRRMEELSEAPDERAARPGPDALATEQLALPLRAACHEPPVRRVRLTDDPEMLELLLSGLLNLP
jgi:hypothetical protein